jgi:trehalose 6-phosphate phosphatase
MSKVPPPAPSLAWAYFLDFDGTLVDIAATPDAAQMDAPLRDLIARLYFASGGALALVSGRAVADIDRRLGDLRLPVAGLHGLQRRDAAGQMWTHAAPPGVMQAIKDALAPVVVRHPELLLEDKGLTVALHYRNAPHLAGYARRLMSRLASPGLEVQFGKCVAEIKPAGIDKGTALAEYLKQPPFKGRRAVFIGDDANDEHGFAELNRRGDMSIKVGKGESCARFYLPNVAAVRCWLAEALVGEPAVSSLSAR